MIIKHTKSGTTNPESSGKIERTALIVAMITSFINPLSLSAVNVALPAIGTDLGANAISLAWIATAYAITAAVVQLPLGKVIDIRGKRRIMIIGAVLFSLSNFLAAISWSSWWMILCRIIQGFGGSMTSIAGMALVSSIFPPNQRGKAIGIIVGAVYAGLSVGPFIGGVLTHYLGWYSMFIFNGLLTGVAAFMAIKGLKGDWEQTPLTKESLDVTGSLIYCTALTTLMIGLCNLPGNFPLILIATGILGLFLFVLQQTKTNIPIINVTIFLKNRIFAFSNFAALTHYASAFSVSFLLNLYLQYVKGIDAHYAGIIMLVQPAVQALLSPFMGGLSDRMEPRILASIGMGCTVVGISGLIGITEDTSLLFIVSLLILLGLGYALFSSPNTNAVMGSVDKNLYGMASSFLGTMRSMGMSVSMAVATMSMSFYIGNRKLGVNTYEGLFAAMDACFFIFMVLCCIGIAASLARGKKT